VINFKKMDFKNKRFPRQHKKERAAGSRWEGKVPFADIPVYKYGTRSTGIRHEAYFEHVREKVPELIVPDLTHCNLKPYVPYNVKDLYQEELTSKDLFNVLYGAKIKQDFKDGKLDADGNSLEPSEAELRTAEEAELLARKTGADVFTGGVPYSKTFALNYEIGKR